MSTINEYTLSDWIRKFRAELNTIRDFTFKTAISDGSSMMIFGDEAVLSKYHNELSRYLTTVELTQREQEFYAYNPRLFSYDIYGEPEFWYLVLYANELASELDFHPKRVRFYNPGVMTLLNSIRTLETTSKDRNEQEISDVAMTGASMNSDIMGSIV